MSAAKDAEGAGDIRVPQWATYASLASLAVLYLMMALWEHLTSLYLFALVAWLVLAGGLLATRLHRRLLGLDGLRLTFVVFLVALGVRLVMLFNDQVITRDIEMFNHRGWEYLNGALPYSDALSVHKPPSYLYLAAGFSATVGPSLLATRALMSIVDGLVAVMVLWMGQDRLSPTLGLMAGMLYALNPISAIAVGLSGHYDPFVVAFALGGLWLALRGRRLWASLALGVGFALKIYPAVLLPWLLLMEKSWRNRVLMVVLFAVPMVLSWIPVLMQNPEALGTYLKWQGSWIPKKGFAWGVAMMMGWERESVAAGAMARVVEYVFYALLVAMFLDWLRRRQRAPDRHLLDWFKVVSVGFYLLYGFIFMGSVMDFRFDLGVDHAVLGVMVAAIYFPLAGGGLWWLLTRWLEPAPTFEGADRTIMLAALSVNLLLLSSAQFNPWYLLWLLPLVLLVRSWRIRDSWNSLLVWNVEGLGVTLWPGVELHPPPTP